VNPLAAVLAIDHDYFRLFGEGQAGFEAFVAFFHLQDLTTANSIKWLDDSEGNIWDFDSFPLPRTIPAYRRYLDNVMAFVAARNIRIREWCESAQ
jgi:hypothetical protein